MRDFVLFGDLGSGFFVVEVFELVVGIGDGGVVVVIVDFDGFCLWIFEFWNGCVYVSFWSVGVCD